jgi:hypothetical protein
VEKGRNGANHVRTGVGRKGEGRDRTPSQTRSHSEMDDNGGFIEQGRRRTRKPVARGTSTVTLGDFIPGGNG